MQHLWTSRGPSLKAYAKKIVILFRNMEERVTVKQPQTLALRKESKVAQPYAHLTLSSSLLEARLLPFPAWEPLSWAMESFLWSTKTSRDWSICTEVTQKQFLPFFVIWAVSSDLFLPFQMSSCWLQQLKIWILLSFHLSFKQNTSPCIWRKSEWNLLGKEQSSMGDKHTDGHCRHKMMTVLRISYSSRSALPGRTCSILPFCYSLPSPS